MSKSITGLKYTKEPISEVKIPLRSGKAEVFLLSIEYGVDHAGENSKRPAVIISPGGGYFVVGTSEAKPVARRFAEAGFKTFTLSYSLLEDARFPDIGPPGPVEDLQAAANYVRDHAEEWNVDPERIVLAGFSAGAHLTVSYFKYLTENTFRPAGLFLAYPLIDFKYSTRMSAQSPAETAFNRKVNLALFGTENPSPQRLASARALGPESRDFPPTFIWHGLDDLVVDTESSRDLAGYLESTGVKHLLHLTDKSIHGQPFAFGDEWFYVGLDWLRKEFF